MRAIVVANGAVEENESYACTVQADDLVIAADGGALIALQLGLEPQVVIGDMDSLPPEARAQLAEGECTFVSHSPRKDETDTELAIQYALQAGAQEIVLLGAIGGRLDHSLANILLLAMPQLERVPATIVAGSTQVWLLRTGCQLEFGGTPGDIVTLLPLGQDAAGVNTEGLEWGLHDDCLSFGPARGVSNVMAADRVRVSLQAGLLVVMHVTQKENGATTMAGQSENQEPDELVTVYAVQGHMRASVIQSKLEAAGIPAILSYEAVSRIYGLTVNGLGQVRILVRPEDEVEARKLLEEQEPSEQEDEQ
jgi:thiamine pyrophosphokinase